MRWATASLTATKAMISSAAPELPPGFGGTRHLAQIALPMAVSATTGSPVANFMQCIQAPALLLPGTGPFSEGGGETNEAPDSGGHRRMASWMFLTRYLAYWMDLPHAYSVRRPGLTRREIATNPSIELGRAWQKLQPPSPRILRARGRVVSGINALSGPGPYSSPRRAAGGSGAVQCPPPPPAA